jgi:ATP-binding cassette, subfamily B, bacterial
MLGRGPVTPYSCYNRSTRDFGVGNAVIATRFSTVPSGDYLSNTNDSWEQLPDDLRRAAEAQLAAGESPLAWFELDLDTHLHYSRGLLVLTPSRLLDIGPIEAADDEKPFSISGDAIRSWPLSATSGIRAKDQTSAGRLELVSPTGLVSHWRYTIGRSPLAHRLANRFQRLHDGELSGGDETGEAPTTVCPSCGAILASGQIKCPDCGSSSDKPVFGDLYRLMGFAKPHKWMVLLGFALMVAYSVANLAPPLFTRSLFNNVLVPAQVNPGSVPFSRVWLFLFAFIAASVLAWLLMWGRTYVMAWASERVTADLRDRTYGHMQGLSLEFFGGKRTGDLIARVSTDSDRICYFLSIYVLDFANNILMLILMAGLLLYLDTRLALATLVPLPVIAFLVHRVRDRMRRGFALGSRAWGEMTSVLADTIPGIRVVKAFAQDNREIVRFRVANDRVFQANCRVNTVWAFFEPVISLLTALGLAVVWGYGSARIFHQDIKVGDLYLFITYIGTFYARMDSMSRMVAATERAGASAHRIFAILDRVPSVAEPVNPVHPGRLKGEVEFRDVGFHYGTRPVLKGVNLTVRPGEMIGLVGPSGSGKSTIVNLVCRFYDIAEGAILADGTDIRSFPLEEYRRNIGIVLQEPFLFYGTIAENIAYGRPDASRKEIIAAARAARAHEFILRLPDGYDSLVGERGQFLSGGERQRVSIARALLIDPAILILDEATSSVDTETEREIQLALENLVQGRTTIAIAHRLSTLRRADRLVVVERGVITEVGPHQELLDRGGTYARLHRAQLEMHEQRMKG